MNEVKRLNQAIPAFYQHFDENTIYFGYSHGFEAVGKIKGEFVEFYWSWEDADHYGKFIDFLKLRQIPYTIISGEDDGEQDLTVTIQKAFFNIVLKDLDSHDYDMFEVKRINNRIPAFQSGRFTRIDLPGWGGIIGLDVPEREGQKYFLFSKTQKPDEPGIAEYNSFIAYLKEKGIEFENGGLQFSYYVTIDNIYFDFEAEDEEEITEVKRVNQIHAIKIYGKHPWFYDDQKRKIWLYSDLNNDNVYALYCSPFPEEIIFEYLKSHNIEYEISDLGSIWVSKIYFKIENKNSIDEVKRVTPIKAIKNGGTGNFLIYVGNQKYNASLVDGYFTISAWPLNKANEIKANLDAEGIHYKEIHPIGYRFAIPEAIVNIVKKRDIKEVKRINNRLQITLNQDPQYPSYYEVTFPGFSKDIGGITGKDENGKWRDDIFILSTIATEGNEWMEFVKMLDEKGIKYTPFENDVVQMGLHVPIVYCDIVNVTEDPIDEVKRINQIPVEYIANEGYVWKGKGWVIDNSGLHPGYYYINSVLEEDKVLKELELLGIPYDKELSNEGDLIYVKEIFFDLPKEITEVKRLNELEALFLNISMLLTQKGIQNTITNNTPTFQRIEIGGGDYWSIPDLREADRMLKKFQEEHPTYSIQSGSTGSTFIMQALARLDEQLQPVKSRKQLVLDFCRYAIQDLGLQKPYPKIDLTSDKEKTQTYGHFSPSDNTIVVYVGNRSLGDILRTIAHELIHRKQAQHNQLGPNSGDTGSPQENEANAYAGVLLRNFGQQNPMIFENLQREVKRVNNQITPTKTYVNDHGFYACEFEVPGDFTVWASVNDNKVTTLINKQTKSYQTRLTILKTFLDELHIPYEESDDGGMTVVSIPMINFDWSKPSIDEVKRPERISAFYRGDEVLVIIPEWDEIRGTSYLNDPYIHFEFTNNESEVLEAFQRFLNGKVPYEEARNENGYIEVLVKDEFFDYGLETNSEYDDELDEVKRVNYEDWKERDAHFLELIKNHPKYPDSPFDIDSYYSNALKIINRENGEWYEPEEVYNILQGLAEVKRINQPGATPEEVANNWIDVATHMHGNWMDIDNHDDISEKLVDLWSDYVLNDPRVEYFDKPTHGMDWEEELQTLCPRIPLDRLQSLNTELLILKSKLNLTEVKRLPHIDAESVYQLFKQVDSKSSTQSQWAELHKIRLKYIDKGESWESIHQYAQMLKPQQLVNFYLELTTFQLKHNLTEVKRVNQRLQAHELMHPNYAIKFEGIEDSIPCSMNNDNTVTLYVVGQDKKQVIKYFENQGVQCEEVASNALAIPEVYVEFHRKLDEVKRVTPEAEIVAKRMETELAFMSELLSLMVGEGNARGFYNQYVNELSVGGLLTPVTDAIYKTNRQIPTKDDSYLFQVSLVDNDYLKSIIQRFKHINGRIERTIEDTLIHNDKEPEKFEKVKEIFKKYFGH
jgi:hypothetical protein